MTKTVFTLEGVTRSFTHVVLNTVKEDGLRDLRLQTVKNKTFEGRLLGMGMGSNRNTVILVSLLLQLLMVGATAAPLADQVNPMGDYQKMNYDLQEELYESHTDTVLPVIFQLNSPATNSDLDKLEEFGATILGDAPLVDGGLFEAKAEDIRRISTWDRVEYLELDKELDFFYLPPSGAASQQTQVR